MKNMNFDQKMRMIIWPLLTVLFINTFGMIALILSGLDLELQSYSTMAISFTLVFRLVLLLVSFVFAFFVYSQQKIRIVKEYTPKGAYNMRGHGIVGFIMHVLIGLIEAAFVFFTLNTFWLITNFTEAPISVIMQGVYLSGFGFIFILSAYFLTRQIGLGVLAYKRHG